MKKKYDPRRDSYGSLVPREKDGFYGGIAFSGSARELAEIFAGEKDGYAYHGLSLGNPTVHKFETLMAAGELDVLPKRAFSLPDLSHFICHNNALATASGMSAIDLLVRFLCNLKGKREFVSSPKIYGGTYNYFDTLVPTMGVTCRFASDPHDLGTWESLINKHTAFLFVETPSNPHADIFDIRALASLAQEYGIPLIVDNTIATYALQTPLGLEADIVVVSASKAVNGRSEELGGVIVANDKDLIIELRNTWGVGVRQVLGPRAAQTMIRGMESLKGRMQKYSRNALELAKLLESSQKVEWISYPFLSSHPAYDIAKRQMSGGSLLMGFTLKGTLGEARYFTDTLVERGAVKQAPHIGHTQTLVIHPASTTHARVPEEKRKEMGITDSFIRVSVGIESPKEFQKVLQAFDDAFIMHHYK